MNKLVSDIFKQRDQINFLLVIATQSRPSLLPHNRHHRLVIHLGIIKTIQEVNRTWPAGCQAHPDFAGEL